MSEIPSEAVQAKAATILLEGRVSVVSLIMGAAPHFAAHVAPSEPGDPYIVKFNASGWHCDCPARVQVCAHVLACQTITDFPPLSAVEATLTFAQSKESFIDDILGLS